MKKTILTLLLIPAIIFAKAQNCIDVNYAYFDNPTGDQIHWRLVINWSANGTKHLIATVTNYGDTLLNDCYQVNGSNGNQSGTKIYNITVASGNVNFIAKIRRFTGTCCNGTECCPVNVVFHTVLPITLSKISARNIGNTTELQFTIEGVDGDNLITLNMVLKNGTKRLIKVQMPDSVGAGQIWKVVINNLTQTYTLVKL